MKSNLTKSALSGALVAAALLSFSHGPRANVAARQSSARAGTQTAAQSQQQQQSTPSEKWERYTYKGEEFSVEMPEMPLVSESVRSVGPLETEPVRTFGVYSGGVIYIITSYDKPRAHETLDSFAGHLLSDPSLKARELKLGGFEGKEYESARVYALRGRIFRAKRHAYFVRAMNYGVEDPRVARFLDSLTLGGKPAGRQIYEQPPRAAAAAPNEPSSLVSGEAYRASEVTRKAVIVFKPEPDYTESARRKDVHGVVRLRAVLAADGKVRYVAVIKELPEGLTQKAIDAALRILFFPAVKDDRTVPQYVTLEYNFNIY